MTIVVDIHNHGIPIGFVERVREDGARFGWTLRTPTAERPAETAKDIYYPEGTEELTTPEGGTSDLRPRRSDEAVRQAELAEAGIDICMESLTPRMMAYNQEPMAAAWSAAAINDGFAENMKAWPDRIIGVGHVPLGYPDAAAAELHRIVEDHGMNCVMIGSSVQGRDLDDPDLDPFWAAAEGLGSLVFVHPTSVAKHTPGLKERLTPYHLVNCVGNPLETSIAITKIIFGGVLDRFPNLKLCFAHAGGYAPWIRGRWRHAHEVRKETKVNGVTKPFDHYFEKLYFDTVIHDEGALSWLIDMVGAEHVIHGTDYAADMGDWHQRSVIEGLPGLSQTDKDNILGGNVLRLIGHD
jgi:aminocarboxymuconate-semialdehyde decarboxylase